MSSVEPVNIPVIDDEQWMFFLEPDIEGELSGGEAADEEQLPGGEAADEEQHSGGEDAEAELEEEMDDDEINELRAEAEREEERRRLMNIMNGE
eukprot:7681122-Heterocapsa_arctica.AAC.1